DHPEMLTLETRVIDAAPGGVVLNRSPFYPVGGQPEDKGVLRWANGEGRVTTLEYAEGRIWHVFDPSTEIHGDVEVAVNPVFRKVMFPLTAGTLPGAADWQGFRFLPRDLSHRMGRNEPCRFRSQDARGLSAMMAQPRDDPWLVFRPSCSGEHRP